MSVNAISSVSLYTYYYQINKTDEQEEESKTAKELKKLGITPTDSESKNVALLKEAQKAQEEDAQNQKTVNSNERPWANILEQLDITPNSNPKDDIKDIKYALNRLYNGLEDEELMNDINNLVEYVENMYTTYYNNDYDSSSVITSISKEVEGLSAVKGI